MRSEGLWIASEQGSQPSLRGLEGLLALGRQVSTGAVDVEGQHRHRRAKSARFATIARLRGAFEGAGDLLRALLFEHVRLQVERIGFGGDLGRPLFLLRGFRHAVAPRSRVRNGYNASCPKTVPTAERRSVLPFPFEDARTPGHFSEFQWKSMVIAQGLTPQLLHMRDRVFPERE